VLFKSKIISDNQNLFIDKCNKAFDKISSIINTKETTWNYGLYNIFAVTAGDEYFYELFKELRKIIKDYHGKDQNLWIQSWINYHKYDELLDWHNHDWLLHGYISIDPKKTRTVFEDGTQIINEIGNIYIGPCNLKHKVIIDEPFVGNRITLGFDVIDNSFENNKISFIPL
jgi:hypothetical protein|tara:strand:+ start:148 stop:660 length:513 start_codon:yes stop_codon:yes gene_type:complete